VLLVPYRGTRLYHYGWRRLCQEWALLHTVLDPARRREAAALEPDRGERPSGRSRSLRGAVTRVLATPSTRERTADAAEAPSWEAAWHAATPVPPDPMQVAGDELDGEVRGATFLLPAASPISIPAASSSEPQTLRQIRARGQARAREGRRF
jgi:hypothetical protein